MVKPLLVTQVCVNRTRDHRRAWSDGSRGARDYVLSRYRTEHGIVALCVWGRCVAHGSDVGAEQLFTNHYARRPNFADMADAEECLLIRFHGYAEMSGRPSNTIGAQSQRSPWATRSVSDRRSRR